MLPTHPYNEHFEYYYCCCSSNCQALLSTRAEDRAPGMGALPEGTRGESKSDKLPKAIVLGVGADSDQGRDATPLPLS